MAEYISREAALMKLMQDGCSAKNLQSISEIPAADVAPVVHGRWIPNTDDFTPANRCSVCGYNDPEIAISRGTYQFVQRQSRSYCPECGAKCSGKDGEVDD